MEFSTTKYTTPEEPFYHVLYIEQKEEVIGCVMDSKFTCQFCKFKTMCKAKG